MRPGAVAASVLLLVVNLSVEAGKADRNSEKETHWVGSWASSPELADTNSMPPAPGFTNCTLRQVVHLSVGGSQIRVRFSNAFGSTGLTISSVHVAKALKNGSIEPESDRPLSFRGQPWTTIPEGAL